MCITDQSARQPRHIHWWTSTHGTAQHLRSRVRMCRGTLRHICVRQIDRTSLTLPKSPQSCQKRNPAVLRKQWKITIESLSQFSKRKTLPACSFATSAPTARKLMQMLRARSNVRRSKFEQYIQTGDLVFLTPHLDQHRRMSHQTNFAEGARRFRLIRF